MLLPTVMSLLDNQLDYSILCKPAPILLSILVVAATAWVYSSYRERIRFRDSHVLITGGSSGIGLCIAHQALAEGARVSIVARNRRKLEDSEAQLIAQATGDAKTGRDRVECFSCDCTDAAAVEETFASAEAALGPIDIFIGSAGGATGGRFEELNAKTLESGLRGNFVSQLHPAHAAFKRMVERNRGHICLIGSMASLVGVFGYSAYTPAKFAVRGLAEVLYYEGAPRGVSVTLALPPDTDTPGYREEVKIMPAETLAVSQGSGIFKAEDVAEKIVNGIKRGVYRVTIGMDGALLGMLTSGMSPGVSLLDVIAMPILRIVSAFYVSNWKTLIRQAYEKRLRQQSCS